MAKKPPPEKHRFKPGQSGNPSGKEKLPEELKAISQFTSDILKREVFKTIYKPMEEIEAIAVDRKTLGIDAMIAAVIVQAVNRGDYSGLDFLLNRTIGKVRESMEVLLPVPTIIKRLDGSEVILGAALAKERDE